MKILLTLLFSGVLGVWKSQFTEAQNKQGKEHIGKNMAGTLLSFCMGLQKPERGNETCSPGLCEAEEHAAPQAAGGFPTSWRAVSNALDIPTLQV